jgi:hypothetical protein
MPMIAPVEIDEPPWSESTVLEEFDDPGGAT